MQAEYCIDIVVIKRASKPTESLTCLYLIVHTCFSFLPPPAPRVTTNPSSISIKLVSQECFLNRPPQHVLFCDDFSSLSVTLSRSIHILCIKISFIEITEHCNVQGSEQITACSYLTIKGHLGNFRLGVMNKVAINFHVSVFMWIPGFISL